VRAEFERSFSRVLEAVDDLPERVLVDPGPFGRLPWLVVAANTFEHYEEHNDAIAEFPFQTADCYQRCHLGPNVNVADG
jgi:hypothetical protein